MHLDGDTLRHGLCGDLAFSAADRTENIRRVAETAKLFFESGAIVLCTFISPFSKDRAFARSLIPEGRFLEVFVNCSLEECERRDPNGLYARVRKGEIKEFTGISSPYEAPEAPEIDAKTADDSVEETVSNIVAELTNRGLLF